MVKIISTLATELEWKVWTSIDGLLTLRFYFPVASERILELQCVAFIPQLLRCFNKKTAQKGYLQEETYIYIYTHMKIMKDCWGFPFLEQEEILHIIVNQLYFI